MMPNVLVDAEELLFILAAARKLYAANTGHSDRDERQIARAGVMSCDLIREKCREAIARDAKRERKLREVTARVAA